MKSNRFGNLLYGLSIVHLFLNTIALLAITVLVADYAIFFEIIYYHHLLGWLALCRFCLLFTLILSACVIIGRIIDKPVLGSWSKKRVEVVYTIGLAVLLVAVALQTWILPYAWEQNVFAYRCLVGCISSWVLLLTWIFFLILHHVKVDNLSVVSSSFNSKIIMGCHHMREFPYILNAVHVLLHFGALFCMTVMWNDDMIFIQILSFKFWYQIFSILTLVFTLAVSKGVFIGGIIEKPLIGHWNKPRVMGIYGFCLVFILISAGLQTWTAVDTASNPFYTARYITGTCFTWALAITWVLFMVAYAIKYRDEDE